MKKALNSTLRVIVAMVVIFTVLSFELTPPKPQFEWFQYVQWIGVGIIAGSISLLVQKQLFDR